MQRELALEFRLPASPPLLKLYRVEQSWPARIGLLHQLIDHFAWHKLVDFHRAVLGLDLEEWVPVDDLPVDFFHFTTQQSSLDNHQSVPRDAVRSCLSPLASRHGSRVTAAFGGVRWVLDSVDWIDRVDWIDGGRC